MSIGPKFPPLRVRALRATPVEVPLNFVLGTSAVAVRKAPLLLVDLETEEGITGRTYLFCYLPAAAPAIISFLGEVERIARGDAIVPADLWKKLTRRFTLIGVLSGRSSGGGAALIAVDGKPAKPFRVGAAVDEGLVLQALGPRQAQLGGQMGGPATLTLDMPLKN